MMTYYLKLYFATLIAFLAIDIVWLGLVAHTVSLLIIPESELRLSLKSTKSANF
jgi:hypothetical protein